jgi:ribosomal protein S18 acetylase RimI-like enzyme
MPETLAIIPAQAGSYSQDIQEIFFESSTKKNFTSNQEREEFRWKYLDFYLTHYPEYAWLAVKGNKLLGYILGMPQTTDARLWEIQPHLKYFSDLYERFPAHLHLNTHADSRGQGVGSVLMQKMLHQFQHHGLAGVHIMTGPSAQNRHFYGKMGFDFTLEREGIYFMARSLMVRT